MGIFNFFNTRKRNRIWGIILLIIVSLSLILIFNYSLIVNFLIVNFVDAKNCNVEFYVDNSDNNKELDISFEYENYTLNFSFEEGESELIRICEGDCKVILKYDGITTDKYDIIFNNSDYLLDPLNQSTYYVDYQDYGKLPDFNHPEPIKYKGTIIEFKHDIKHWFTSPPSSVTTSGIPYERRYFIRR